MRSPSLNEIQPMSEQPERQIRFVFAVTATGALAALVMFAWRGWYSRYLTDDYCTSNLLSTLGFFEAMAWHRANWSGRFSYFPLKAVFESFGAGTTRITPALMIVLFWLAALVTLRTLKDRISKLASIAASLAFVFAIVDASPSLTNIGGSLYWETGSVTYLPPLMLYTLWLALFSSSVRPQVAYGGSALLMFVAGGFSETSLAAQGAFTAAALIVALLGRDRRAARIAGTGLVASLAALGVVASAPGNAVRAEIDAAPRTPIETVLECFRLANEFIGTYLFADGLAVLPLALLTFMAATRLGRRDPKPALGVGAIALCGYLGAFVPAAWLLRGGPPERSLDVPNYFMIVMIVAGACAAGFQAGPLTHRSRMAVAVAAVVLLVAPLVSIRENLETLPRVREIAAKADDADRLLRASRGEAVALHAPWAVNNRIFSEDRDHWSNRCVSRYYGLQSFHATR